MKTSLAVLALLLWQAVPPASGLEQNLLHPITSVGLGGLIFWFYRGDRKDSESRYGKLAEGYRGLIEANTAAITKLTERLDR